MRSKRRGDNKATNERAYQHNKQKEKYNDLTQRKMKACVLRAGESRQNWREERALFHNTSILPL
jgi:hypothetical protein